MPRARKPHYVQPLPQPKRFQCTRCQEWFAKADLYRPIHGVAVRLRQQYCGPCFERLATEWTAASTRTSLDSHYRRTYGIRLADVGRLHMRQSGVCAICKNAERPSKDNDRPRLLAVDHDHTSGRIRGLLCSNCNTAIGLLGEDVSILASAIIYLTGGNPQGPPLDLD